MSVNRFGRSRLTAEGELASIRAAMFVGDPRGVATDVQGALLEIWANSPAGETGILLEEDWLWLAGSWAAGLNQHGRSLYLSGGRIRLTRSAAQQAMIDFSIIAQNSNTPELEEPYVVHCIAVATPDLD